MKPSELLVINICREQRARWTLPQKLIIHSFLSHTLSPCDMRSMELHCFAALNGNSTYSAASIACNCVERYFEMSASLPQTQKPKLEILLCFCRILVALNEVREKYVLQCSLLRRSSLTFKDEFSLLHSSRIAWWYTKTYSCTRIIN